MEKSEFTKEEWWLVAQKVRPDLDKLKFDMMWEDFQRNKEIGIKLFKLRN